MGFHKGHGTLGHLNVLHGVEEPSFFQEFFVNELSQIGHRGGSTRQQDQGRIVSSKRCSVISQGSADISLHLEERLPGDARQVGLHRICGGFEAGPKPHAAAGELEVLSCFNVGVDILGYGCRHGETSGRDAS